MPHSDPIQEGGQEDPAVTHLLSRCRAGDTTASDRLLALVYGELQSLARGVFSGQNPAHTLQPTALVHEAWLKLRGHLESIDDRRHFFVVAARAMRQVLADHAKGRLAEKRGGKHRQVTLDTSLGDAGTGADIDLIDLDDCLRRLAERSPRLTEVAELRLFGGLAIAEIAEALGLSRRSVDSDWAMARAWLQKELAAG